MLVNVVCGGARGRAPWRIGQCRPPWLGCVFLPSFCLANHESDVPLSPQTTQNPTTVSPHISVNNNRMGYFKYPSCVHAWSEDTWAIRLKGSFILGAGVPGEASETMVELCLWPSIVRVHKLAIYCDYIQYILRTTDPLKKSWCSSFDYSSYFANSMAATKTKPIGNYDDCRFMTIVNSTSTAARIGLPSKMAKFCHTSNRMLVGPWRHSELLRLYFSSSAGGHRLLIIGWLVSQSTIVRVPGLWEVSLQKDTIRVPGLWEVSLQKDMGSRALKGFPPKGWKLLRYVFWRGLQWALRFFPLS